MNKLLSALFTVVMGFAISVPDADARRFGGGRSLGTQRDAVRQQQVAPSKPAQAPQAAPAAAAASRWGAPLAGLLAGGLLGAMIFGGAFDGFKFIDFAMILLLAGAAFFVLRMLRKPSLAQHRPEPMRYASADARVAHGASTQPISAAAPVATPLPAANFFPSGFDPEAFSAQAKRNFLRLQEANDRGDLSAIRDVMTPELYKEIDAQVRERGHAAQKTEIGTLDATVVEVVTEGSNYIASVRFSGMIKEDAEQPEHFSEIWHLQKPLNGSSGWQLAGIQQD